MNTRGWSTWLTGLLLALLLAGGAGATDKIKTVKGSEDNPISPQDESFSFSSEEGDFRVRWPSGCSQVKTRSRQVDDDAQEQPVIVYCDRNGEKGEGCSVTALFNISGGGSPEMVMDRMMKVLGGFGASITNQKPLRKEFEGGFVVEGLDVLASPSSGAGQVWVRGLLVGGDIYLLSAWDQAGEVAHDPEYIAFFESFQPGAE